MPTESELLETIEARSAEMTRAFAMENIAIVEALRAGVSLRKVARASGYSHEKVRQMAIDFKVNA